MSETPRDGEQARRLPRKRWWLPPLIIVGLIGMGLAALPYYLEHRIVAQLSAMTGREVTLQDVDINPFMARATLSRLVVASREQGDAPLFASDKTVIDVGWASLWQHGWTLDRLDFHSPRLQLIWQRDGQWNFSRLFAGNGQGGTSALRIHELHIDDGQLTWLNRHRSQPATLTLDHLTLDGQGFDSQRHTPFSLTGHADWNGGTLDAKGRLGFAPWLADLDFTPRNVPLVTLSAYLSSLMRAQVAKGTVDGRIHLLTGQASDSGLKLSAHGALNGLELHTSAGDSLARVQHVSFDDVRYTSASARWTIGQIALDGPWLNAVVTEQLDTNLIAFMPPDRAGSETADSSRDNPAQRNATPTFTLDRLTVAHGKLAFSDRHLPQPFNIDIGALSGQLTGLSTAPDSTGELTLAGRVADQAPMHIEGTFSPLGKTLSSDLRMHFDSMALKTFAPYVRYFAGYEVEQGEVALDLHYRLEHERLQADNHVLLRRLDLGERVNDHGTTSLPLKEIINLLQSDDGEIQLDVPVTISLDGSALDVKSIVWQAIGEALENLVTSPGDALSALLGGENSDEKGSKGARSGQDWMSAIKTGAPRTDK